MNQLIYIMLIFVLSFTFATVYMKLIYTSRIVKLLVILSFSVLFSFIVYKYNYFVINEYVFLSVLYGVYISYVVKKNVNKLKNSKK